MPFPADEQRWRDALARLKLRAEDFEESFARSSGPGGQNVNKVSTAVTLRHAPSGRAVTAQDHRSQARNRLLARERLLALIERERHDAAAAARAEREKTRRRNALRPRGVRIAIREGKRRRGAVKQLRQRPDAE